MTGALAQIIAQAGALTDLPRKSLVPQDGAGRDRPAGRGAGPSVIESTATTASSGVEAVDSPA